MFSVGNKRKEFPKTHRHTFDYSISVSFLILFQCFFSPEIGFSCRYKSSISSNVNPNVSGMKKKLNIIVKMAKQAHIKNVP